MSYLYLVRHGQASFGQADYDRLSELGVRQARLVGEYWARTGLRLDAVYTGTLRRQVDSAGAAAEAYREAGLAFPDPVRLEEWNEYSLQALLTGGIPPEVLANERVRTMVEAHAPDGRFDPARDPKAMSRLLGLAMDLWVDGALGGTGMEKWSDFTGRVSRGFEKIRERTQAGSNVAVFTSGGPITACAQLALETPDKKAMRLGWTLRNSSISEFRFDNERFSAVSFNATPHLDDPSLFTVR